MRSHLLNYCAISTLCILCGCASLRHSPTEPPEKVEEAPTETAKSPADLATRNNALALLYDLLGDEKNVSKVLIIKRNSEKLGRVIKEISAVSGEGAKTIEAMARSEPSINLKATDLPPGETATRKAISKTKEHTLLHSKGAEFEFQLLLTQVEAMNYGAHLAMVVAENESDPDRVREFLRMSSQLRGLGEQVLAQLRK